MGNLLNKFSKTTLGNNKYISDYSSKISPSGDFSKITKLNVILLSWFHILTTPKETADHDPEFGCGIQKYLFKLADGYTSDELKDDIRTSLMKYDNRAKLTDVQVKLLKNKKGFYVELHASYQGDRDKISFTLDENSFFIFQN